MVSVTVSCRPPVVAAPHMVMALAALAVSGLPEVKKSWMVRRSGRSSVRAMMETGRGNELWGPEREREKSCFETSDEGEADWEGECASGGLLEGDGGSRGIGKDGFGD